MSDKGTNENSHTESTGPEELNRERYELLHRLEDWLETPMLVLAFVWLVLLVMELIQGESQLFFSLGIIIWVVFIIDFAVKLVLAPDKVVYFKRNWLTAIALLIPALRIFRIFRAFRLLRLARAGRGLRLARVVSSLNRGMKALAASLNRRGFGYVITLTLLVTFAGAAGMYTFENEAPGGPRSYVESLWWTAMIMTTMGSQYWPQTGEGRVLCVFLALYAFGIFGYVTAALATFFVGRDADNSEAEVAGAKGLAAVRDEVSALRDEIRALSRQQREL
jgi:voltage-gated potassium channel